MSEHEYIKDETSKKRIIADEKALKSVDQGSRENELETIGNTSGISILARSHGQRRRVANPDDPLVQRPLRGPKGIWPGPNYLGIEGRAAIVQAQVFIVAVILIIQLWLVTDALYELLSGRPGIPGWLALASFIGFVLALIVTFWPRRRIERS